MTAPLRIVVLAGGRSAEREVSLRSGAAVAAALRRGGHDVHELDPAACNLEMVDWRAFQAVNQPAAAIAPVDAVFLALHGEFGEDGQVQQILERAGVPYTGSGPEASRIAFSKFAAKEAFRRDGIPTPDWEVLRAEDSPEDWRLAADRIGLPLVVKPDQQGSSLGVTIVTDWGQFDAALAESFRYDRVGLIERAIPGEEWTVAVLDDLPLPPIRIESSHLFFDFHAKYAADDTRFVFDDRPPACVTETALAACRALDVRGISRVDLRLDEAGRPWVLEVNTVPGMTDRSLAPRAAARIGWDMTEFCERVLCSALEGARRQNAYGLSDRPGSRPHRRAG
ncbi:MAG: D-alanine--D-alanine ligase [Planctomyces sp.]|nr:D-alanine--D-alanine ligase [Planctomyces sp.]